VWRAATAFFAELGEASRRIGEITAQPPADADTATTDGPSLADLAVFDSAARLRQELARSRR